MEISMVELRNVFDNKNMICKDQSGVFTIFEHQKDLSVGSASAQTAYFMSQMNVRRRQVLCTLKGNEVRIQSGAMQWLSGDVTMETGVTGVKNFLGKVAKGVVTGESAVKPTYKGNGYLMLEPTYNHLFIEDVSTWEGGIVLDDGLFLACDSSLEEKIVKRSDVTTALMGAEGIFNLKLIGSGLVVLESHSPREELFEFVLDNDEVKIDGNMAVAWSGSLDFRTENVTKTFTGTLLSGEGVVNVYRGSGKILVAPTMNGTNMNTSKGPEQTKASNGGLLGSIAEIVS